MACSRGHTCPVLIIGGGSEELTTDSDFAYAVTGIMEATRIPYLSLGIAPRIIFNVGNDKELDLRVRIRGHVAVRPGVELYAAFMPGFSSILASQPGAETWSGFALGGAAGITYDVSPYVFFGAELGYQRAYTTTTQMAGSETITPHWDISYMHIGLGVGVRL